MNLLKKTVFLTCLLLANTSFAVKRLADGRPLWQAINRQTVTPYLASILDDLTEDPKYQSLVEKFVSLQHTRSGLLVRRHFTFFQTIHRILSRKGFEVQDPFKSTNEKDCENTLGIKLCLEKVGNEIDETIDELFQLEENAIDTIESQKRRIIYMFAENTKPMAKAKTRISTYSSKISVNERS